MCFQTQQKETWVPKFSNKIRNPMVKNQNLIINKTKIKRNLIREREDYPIMVILREDLRGS